MPDAEQFILTAGRHRILRLLVDHRVATVELLARAYAAGNGGRGASYVAHEARRLFDAGLVDRTPAAMHSFGNGSSELVYRCTLKGIQAVVSPREYLEARATFYRLAEEKVSYAHSLAVATLRHVLEFGASRWELEEFRHDREDTETRIRVKTSAGIVSLWPDAEAVLRFPNGQRGLFVFELELNRKSNPRTDQRLRAYATWLTAHVEEAKRRRGVSGVVVVFVVPDANLLRGVMDRARAVAREFAPRVPPFLGWLQDWWVDREGSGRRTLREPQQILRARQVINLKGEWRRLVEGIQG